MIEAIMVVMFGGAFNVAQPVKVNEGCPSKELKVFSSEFADACPERKPKIVMNKRKKLGVVSLVEPLFTIVVVGMRESVVMLEMLDVSVTMIVDVLAEKCGLVIVPVTIDIVALCDDLFVVRNTESVGGLSSLVTVVVMCVRLAVKVATTSVVKRSETVIVGASDSCTVTVLGTGIIVVTTVV